MKIAIPGGTGQLGTVLARAFHRDGHDVLVLGRTPRPAPWRVERWDPDDVPHLAEKLDGAEVVINLAGRSVNCRYNTANRHEIIASRVQSVGAVGEAIARARRPPQVWLQASTATIYAHTFGPPHDEVSGMIGGSELDVPDTWRFSIDVATTWERAFEEIETPSTRKVILRSALTMNPDRGGIFDALLGLVRCGLGGTMGDGGQYVSWIHETDFIRALYFLIAREDISSVVNVCSPNPLPNRKFMEELRRAWGMPIGLPSPRWMLEIGALLRRTETELVLKSRRVVPGRLLREGFSFVHTEWSESCRELCERWRSSVAAQPPTLPVTAGPSVRNANNTSRP